MTPRKLGRVGRAVWERKSKKERGGGLHDGKEGKGKLAERVGPNKEFEDLN